MLQILLIVAASALLIVLLAVLLHLDDTITRVSIRRASIAEISDQVDEVAALTDDTDRES